MIKRQQKPQQQLRSEHRDDNDNVGKNLTLLWWAILSLIALANISLYVHYILYPYLSSSSSTSSTSLFVSHLHLTSRFISKKQLHVILSGIYVIVCAYRSFFPRIDLERLVLWNSFSSSVFLGRSAATIAEISFAIQLSFLLNDLSNAFLLKDSVQLHEVISTLASLLPILLTIAQGFCWCSVLSLNHLFHAIEESLWAIGGAVTALTFGSVLFTSSFSSASSSSTLTISSFFGFRATLLGFLLSLCFFLFMVLVDVPMYLRRWREGRRGGTTYLSFSYGVRDALNRRIATKKWKDWKEEVSWLTGYFSSGVWFSLFMAYSSSD